ncbi:LytTR family DNA-binding domain-containing protein [Bacteroidia bacterium]|nr:LytTR family DNA-binding domain-containing protein [Bacteroidia bacterium]
MPDKLSVIIADDEQTSRDLIERYVNKYCTNLEVISKAIDAKDAIAQIKELKPDLVFLDVEMPFGNAFDVLEQTQEVDYQTIFITAYSDYAIKALNYSAAYYILKPIRIDELVSAVYKVQAMAQEDNFRELKRVLQSNLGSDSIERIVLPNQSGFEIIDANQIIRIAGSGNYSDIYLADGKKKTISKTLKFFEKLEENKNIIRVHKSHIVNVDYIAAYKKGRGGVLIMSDDSEVEVSARLKTKLLSELGL